MRTSSRALGALTGLALAGTLTVGISACGAISQIEPKVAFAKAYGSTISQNDLTTKVSFKTTSADIEKLMTAAEKSSSSTSTPIPPATRKAIADILPKFSVTSRVHSNGKSLSEETNRTKLDEDVSISLDGSGIEVMRTGKEAFVKADVAGIGQKTGLFTGTQVAMMTDQVPAEMSWIKDVVNGKWIGLPSSTVESMFKDNNGSLAGDPVKMKEAREKIQSSLERNASFEKTGSSDAGDEMTVKVKLKPFLNDMKDVAKTTGGTTSTANLEASDLKEDAVLTVKAIMKDDRVTHAETDIPQMFDWFDTSKMKESDKKGLEAVKSSGFKGAIVMDMSTAGGAVTKPTGARMLTEDDLKSVSKLMAPKASSTSGF